MAVEAEAVTDAYRLPLAQMYSIPVEVSGDTLLMKLSKCML